MSGARPAFNLDAPFVVACESLVCGSRRMKRGDLFPWRDLGVSEHDLLVLWVALKIDATDAPSTAPSLDIELDRLTPSQLADLEAATAPRPMARAGRRR